MKDKTETFLKEILKIYEKYNLSLSHEDSQGAFIIEKYKKENAAWLKNAIDKTKKEKLRKG
ncbi:MAG: hypothetical protein ACOCQR_01765 [bacterium]